MQFLAWRRCAQCPWCLGSQRLQCGDGFTFDCIRKLQPDCCRCDCCCACCCACCCGCCCGSCDCWYCCWYCCVDDGTDGTNAVDSDAAGRPPVACRAPILPVECRKGGWAPGQKEGGPGIEPVTVCMANRSGATGREAAEAAGRPSMGAVVGLISFPGDEDGACSPPPTPREGIPWGKESGRTLPGMVSLLGSPACKEEARPLRWYPPSIFSRSGSAATASGAKIANQKVLRDKMATRRYPRGGTPFMNMFTWAIYIRFKIPPTM